MEDAIILVERSRRPNNKYRAEEISYRAGINAERLPKDATDAPLVITTDLVRELFTVLIRRTTESLRPSDRIRFCIQADGLDKPISTCLLPVKSVTIEKLLSAVMKVLQSKNEIQMDSTFVVDVITITQPIGAGGSRKITNISLDRIGKKSVLDVPYDDEGLCCAKAIISTLAYVRKDRTAINSLRDRRRPALMNRARALHEEAAVPLGPCTFQEVAQFEEFLGIQIVVYAAENFNKVSIFL